MEISSASCDSRLNIKTPAAMTATSKTGMITQTYHGRLFEVRPPMVNSKKGPITVTINPTSAAARVYELAETDLSFITVSWIDIWIPFGRHFLA